MKNEKGVTLISLIMYVLIMTFVVAAIAAITSTFNENLTQIDQDSESSVAFSKFNMYFLNDIKANNARINSYTSSSIDISYTDDDGSNKVASYTVNSEGLYRNKVKICDRVNEVNISADKASGVVSIYLKIKTYEKTTTYKVEPKISIE